jgi:multimeric flavodoxin WrbA
MTLVVALASSPSTGGDTDKLLARFSKGAEAAGAQVERVAVAELGITGWTPEVDCQEPGSERVDDAFATVSQRLVAADVIVVASPVYFRNVPAQLKALIDRSQCQWIRKYVDKEPLPASSAGHSRRRGVLLSTGGNDREHFAGTVQTIKSFFQVYETDYWGELLFGGVDARALEEEPLAFQQAYDLGFRAVTEAWAWADLPRSVLSETV